MLSLRDIHKTYVTGDYKQEALDGIALTFRENEFAAILGQSGSGKTTMLNIVGGLDQYSSGDLIINGTSTKKYKSRDWDTYRNHSIGFVFQSYQLIPHQTILSNVELALTLSGVSKSERRSKAVAMLEKVGLLEQIHKRPNQLSGGQMQRVAIARALINDPDILLADEPTGALDSETSILIMKLLKEIAQDRLVIMVTHNPELADEYATRIIRLKDGRILDDSNPYSDEEADKDTVKSESSISTKKNKAKGRKKKTSMSFLTALSLSMNNLMTKKGRTIMTAFAGSIGIIGIALILSVSNGVQEYINRVEEDTLSSYPLEIERESVDMTSMMATMMGDNHKEDNMHDLDAVYSSNIMKNMIQAMTTQIQSNDLASFRSYLEDQNCPITPYINDVKYGYQIDLNIYKSDTENGVKKVNPGELFANMGMGGASANSLAMFNYEIWTEMLGNQELLSTQYDVIAGNWPTSYDEVVLVVDENNEISDYVLYSLGLMDDNELMSIMSGIMTGETSEINTGITKFSYDDILNTTYKLILNTDYYVKAENGYIDMSTDAAYMKNIVDNALTLKITGIVRPTENAVSSSIGGALGYTSLLTEYLIRSVQDTEIVQEQLADSTVNVITGNQFDTSDFQNTYDSVCSLLGIVDLEEPSSIQIYPNSFSSKDEIIDLIEQYNQEAEENGKEDMKISYTDMVGILMSSVTTIVNVISYVLIAFVAISLIVSSIMIGIITYISVLERTREIGILRSIGASKKDISRVFNAETLLIGLVAGLIGIGITLLLLIPINMIIKSLSGISGIATLPVVGAIILVAISMLLTFIAGLIPSGYAAKRNPVEALRSE